MYEIPNVKTYCSLLVRCARTTSEHLEHFLILWNKKFGNRFLFVMGILSAIMEE